MKNNKFIILFVLIQLIIICFLGRDIYNKRNNILGTEVSVNPINKDEVVFPANEGLKNFYEPKPNTIQHPKLSWLKDVPTLTINSDGLNERYEYSLNKPPGTYRIVTIGDSFTFGAYVDTPNNYPEQLEEALNNELKCKNIKKFEIVNLGVGGYDIQYSVERFKLRGQKYSPDLVLWLLKDDDFKQIAEITKPKMDLYRKQMETTGELEESYKRGKFYPYTEKVVQELRDEYTEQEILGRQTSFLASIKNYYKNKLLLLTFPFVSKKYQSIMEDFSTTRKDTYFYGDLFNFKSSGKSLPDGHPNTDGYTLIANDIFKYLMSNKIIPCE